ncbi:hypothetical protein [Actinomadura sp. B10D3]|uniref:hypothetical protein n=1 Tax=Actinomadura sp. B10D3 TaxID=3153557 RepID=UPI00325DD8CC
MRTLLDYEARPAPHRTPHGAVETHEQRLHRNTAAVTPDEQLRSALASNTTVETIVVAARGALVAAPSLKG